MSICWNCEKKMNCTKLYLEGEQKDRCLDREQAHKSIKSYTKWLAKASNYRFNSIYKGETNE